jgi:plastin-3
MRAYTLSILTQLANTGSPIVEKEIVTWVNNKLASAHKKSSLKSFQVSCTCLQADEFSDHFLQESASTLVTHKNAFCYQDSSVADAKVVIDLIDAIKPGAINYELVKEGGHDEVSSLFLCYQIPYMRIISRASCIKVSYPMKLLL